MFDLLSLARRAYNLTIEHFVNTPHDRKFNLTDLRRSIRCRARQEWEGRRFLSTTGDEAINTAWTTRQAIIRKRKRGEKCDYGFRSIKQSRQSFVLQKMSRSFVETNFDMAEPIPEHSYGRLTNIVWERGRWYVCASDQEVTCEGVDNQELRAVAIDPGVRTFATAYAPDSVTKYGGSFFGSKVLPLLLRLDALLSRRRKFLNKNEEKETRETKFFRDTMRHLQKRIFKLHNRVSDLIDDLHKRVAFDLVSRYDLILLPKFETKQMSNRIKRRIGTKTVRAMLGLAHYKFQQTLGWMARKYGKLLLSVNESYTSKTISWTGDVVNNLGGSKLVKAGNLVVCRDVNGARGILLRALTR